MPSTGRQDIVFCKNVAIYFQADVRNRVMRGLHDMLSDFGYLVLGHSDTMTLYRSLPRNEPR
jgi:chemotaxis protein methyltransferase CheR